MDSSAALPETPLRGGFGAFGEALLLEGTNLALFLKTNPEFKLHNGSLWILTMDGAKRLASLKGEKPKYLQMQIS